LATLPDLGVGRADDGPDALHGGLELRGLVANVDRLLDQLESAEPGAEPERHLPGARYALYERRTHLGEAPGGRRGADASGDHRGAYGLIRADEPRLGRSDLAGCRPLPP
jgi:hypothetical protein